MEYNRDLYTPYLMVSLPAGYVAMRVLFLLGPKMGFSHRRAARDDTLPR